MRKKLLIIIIILLLIIISFSGCTYQHYYSQQEKEIPPNETYSVHEKADTSLEIGYSWMIINATGNNTSINKTVFRILAPSGKEVLSINTTEKNRLYEGSIKCKEDGIYELSWENTDINNSIVIKYDWDYVQENSLFYDFICYGVFLLPLLIILVMGRLLYMKHKKIKRLEKTLREAGMLELENREIRVHDYEI